MRKSALDVALALALALALVPAALPLTGEGGPATTGGTAGKSAGQAGATGAVAAAPGPYRVDAAVDWQRRVLSLHVSLDLAAAGLSLPEGRLAAERLVGRDLPGLAKDPFFALRLDSRRTIGDSIVEGGADGNSAGSVDVSAILDLARLLVRREDSLSHDLLSYVSVWELPLGAAAALYVRGTTATPLPRPLSWVATRAYTGIVIYADRDLPVHGERGAIGRLEEALFPRIFDTDMNPVLERATVDPAVLVSHGPMAYAAVLDSSAEDRVGTDPLRIVATGLFGINRTDLLIPKAEADRILANDANRRLIAGGKILVIVGRR
jgi:hypothetical protein